METNSHYEPGVQMRIQLTRHSEKRAKQRGIPRDAIKLIVAYGKRTHDGIGGLRILMTEESIREVRRAVGHTQGLDHLAGAYVVLDAETETNVITTGHRH